MFLLHLYAIYKHKSIFIYFNIRIDLAQASRYRGYTPQCRIQVLILDLLDLVTPQLSFKIKAKKKQIMFKKFYIGDCSFSLYF